LTSIEFQNNINGELKTVNIENDSDFVDLADSQSLSSDSTSPIVENLQEVQDRPKPIDTVIQPIENMVAPAAAPLFPVNMRANQPEDCPISLEPLPIFYGHIGNDPNKHVSEFLTTCNANNARTDVHWYAIFPTTLEDHAKQWFYRQPLSHFADWQALHDAFIGHFRPIGYDECLSESLHELQMKTNETIDSYYGRMEDIILRLLVGHGFNDAMKLGIFIRGLVPFKLKGYVKEVSLATLLEAQNRAKLYENI